MIPWYWEEQPRLPGPPIAEVEGPGAPLLPRRGWRMHCSLTRPAAVVLGRRSDFAAAVSAAQPSGARLAGDWVPFAKGAGTGTGEGGGEIDLGHGRRAAGRCAANRAVGERGPRERGTCPAPAEEGPPADDPGVASPPADRNCTGGGSASRTERATCTMAPRPWMGAVATAPVPLPRGNFQPQTSEYTSPLLPPGDVPGGRSQSENEAGQPGRAAHSLKDGARTRATKKGNGKKTFNNGSLGSRIDEERSEMR